MANIIGFDQAPDMPPGIGDVHFDTGESVFMQLPPDMVPPPQPQPMLADNSGMSAPEPNMSVADAPPAPTYSQADVVAGQAQQANQALGQAITGQQPAPAGPPSPMDQMRAHLTERGEIWDKGSPGSPGGWHFDNKSKEVTTEGAPYSTDEAQMRADLYGQLADAHMAGVAHQVGALSNEAAGAASQYIEETRRAERTKTAAELTDHRYQAIIANARQDLEDHINNNRPTVGKLWQERGAFAVMIAAISQAFGVYAAILGHAPNFAQQIIEDMNAKDMQTAEEQYQAGIDLKNNIIARYERQYGIDHEEAKELIQSHRDLATAANVRRFAAETKIPEVIQQGQEWAAQLQLKAEETERGIRDKAVGKTVKKESEKYSAGTPARSAGWRLGTPKEQKESAEALAAIDKVARGGDGGDRDDVWAGMKPNEKAVALGAYRDDYSKIIGFETSMKDAVATLGGTILPNGEVKLPDEVVGFTAGDRFMRWATMGVGLPGSTKERMAWQATDAVAATYAQAVSGANVPNEEYIRLKNVALGKLNSMGLKKGMQELANQVAAKKGLINSTSPPAMVRYYERRLSEEASKNNERSRIPAPEIH